LVGISCLGVSKKTEKPKKNNWKNRTVKKKSIKPIKILKKPIGSIRFQFYKHKTKKTELNPNKKKLEKKPRQTGKNRAKLVFVLKNRTESKPAGLNRFRFFFFNSVWLLFFDKNRIEPKMITPSLACFARLCF
jgi:hypothetical protein